MIKTIMASYSYKVGDTYISKGVQYIVTKIERDHTIFALMHLKAVN